MAKFCGKCGIKLDEATKLCPKCDADQLKKIRKNYKGHKKEGKGFIKYSLIIMILILCVIGTVEALVYFDVVNVSSIKELLGRAKTDSNTLANITEFQALSDGFTDRKIEDKETALKAIDDVSEKVGIKNAKAVFTDCTEDTAMDNTYYRFQQEYEGIPVYGRSVIVSADKDGNSLMFSGNYLDVDGTETKPEIDSSEAISIVREKYQKEETTIFNEGLTIYSLDGNTPELTWQVLAANSDGMEYYFVSAGSGKIIEELSLCATESGESVEASGQDVDGVEQKFTTLKVGNEYLLNDIKRGIRIYDAENTTVTAKSGVIDSQNKIYTGKDGKWIDESGNEVTIYGENFSYVIKDAQDEIVGTNGKEVIIMGSGLKPVTNSSTVWENQKAVTVMRRTAIAYDFWNQKFKRKSYDNKDGLVLVAYNDYNNGDITNAYSWGTKNLYARLLGFGTDNPLSLDTVAHEYTHAVEGSISNMNYQGESGALMEGYSDVFGEIVEDWYDNGEFDGSCDWNSNNRNLKSPSQSDEGEYPDTYHGRDWKDTNDTVDHGWVHNNSTVISHAAYLMWTGIGGHVAYEALGTEQIAELFYQTLYSLPSDCTFSEFRTLLQNTANIMWKQGNLSEKQYWCVSNAMFQVGILPTPAEYKVSQDFELSVYDINKNLYDNYSVKISRVEEDIKQDQWEDITYTVDTSDPLPLSLNSGRYKMEVTDSADESNVYTLYITTSSKNEENSLNLNTIFGSEKKPTTVNIYNLYAEKIREYEEQYGEAEVRDDDSDIRYMMGLCFAKLVDFAGDGQKELLVVYADDWQESIPENYTAEVWTVTDGQLVMLHSGEVCVTDGGFEYLELWTGSENAYLCSGGFGNEWYGFDENGQFTLVREATMRMSQSGGLIYEINGKEVSQEEFEQNGAEWTDGYELDEYQLSNNPDSDKIFSEIEETKKELNMSEHIN